MTVLLLLLPFYDLVMNNLFPLPFLGFRLASPDIQNYVDPQRIDRHPGYPFQNDVRQLGRFNNRDAELLLFVELTEFRNIGKYRLLHSSILLL